MARRFKLRIGFPSFRFCRLKQLPFIPGTHSPAASNLFSPVNSKAFDISFPNYFPDPPPSTPVQPFSKRQFPSKTAPISCGCRSTDHKRDNPCRQTHHPPVSGDSSSSQRRITPQNSGKKMTKRKDKNRGRKPSADYTGWFSDEEETESLVLSSRSFDSSYDFGYSDEREIAVDGGRRPEKQSIVKESLAVVKRSEDPYEDFKRSMLEMILEKQMFDGDDLEQLLRCFLSLNSRRHHAAIVEAFTEIWELLFPTNESPRGPIGL